MSRTGATKLNSPMDEPAPPPLTVTPSRGASLPAPKPRQAWKIRRDACRWSFEDEVLALEIEAVREKNAWSLSLSAGGHRTRFAGFRPGKNSYLSHSDVGSDLAGGMPIKKLAVTRLGVYDLAAT